MKKTRIEKGITLIALIITIVVLLILAVVTINAIKGDGIIKHAQNSRSDYTKAQEDEQSTLEDYLDEIVLGTNNYVVSTTEEGVPIPVGFKYVTGTKDTGVVIENREEGSQFVWVPVTTDIVPYGLNSADKREPDVVTGVTPSETVDSASGLSYDDVEKNLILAGYTIDGVDAYDFKDQITNEFNDMASSVKKYGGFYVGRYETSISSSGKAQSKGSTDSNLIKSATAEATSGNTWYGLYALNKTYSTNSVQGTLIWGSQYEAMMTWMKNTGTDVDSQIEGYNTTRYTGNVETDVINNIYDLYGNSYEYTMEANGSASRINRGGAYNYNKAPNYTNGNSNLESTSGIFGSRLALCIGIDLIENINIEGSELKQGGIIPEGGEYTSSDGTLYSAGNSFPEKTMSGDTYTYGDYIYTSTGSSWSVKVKDKNKTQYGDILIKINGSVVKSLYGGSQSEGCFYNCKSLTTSPTIPSTITDMRYAFYGCTSLTVAPEIPNSVQQMNYTFRGCTSLTETPKFPSSLLYMEGTFYGCTSLTTASYITGKVTTMKYAFYGCTSLKKTPSFANATKSLTSISHAFEGCTSLAGYNEYSLPVHTRDFSYAFKGCTSLKSVPLDYMRYDQYATTMEGMFQGCTSLKSAILPVENRSKVKNISRCFEGCTSLTSGPIVPSSVTNMTRTFNGCTSLTGSITINANPTSYSSCFALSSNGKDITLKGSSTKLQELANTSTAGYRIVYDENGNILKQ